MPRFIPTLPTDRDHLPLIGALIILLLALVLVFYGFNTAVKVDGDSMLPGLANGDRVLVSRGYDFAQRGDIISFSAVIDGKRDSLIKRVVAIGGDVVEVTGDTITVNGKPESGGYSIMRVAEDIHLGPFTVPIGSVYVLGDNRPVSLDSRFFGAVPLTDVKGKAVFVFSPITHIRRIDVASGRP